MSGKINSSTKQRLKEFIFNNRLAIIGIFGLLFVIALSITLFGSTYSLGDNISVEEVISVINNKENRLIYILNSNSSNQYNKKILNHLVDNNISFSVYDISKVEKEELNSLLSTLDINGELFNVPAIIYIREGVMFANLINIDDISVVEKFISDYDLKVNV